MKDNSQVLLLGIPFDNLTMPTAVKKILNMAGQVKTLGGAKLVATVNVDFLTKALSWLPTKTPRHPELLDILRKADLVTADGMPLVWLSRILKSPLKERVAGSDLVPALAKAASETGHSLFFLGGKGYVAHKAAETLKTQFPNLNVAGVYAPFVYSEGEQMLESEQDDKKIVEYINQSNADILLIGFGNPKQELFFQRNRHQLNVGVAIGVGGTFEFITGRVARAPVWMQKSGLEWLYRISQDPARLWKRYALGLAKLGVMAGPLIVYNKVSQLFLSKATPQRKQQHKSQTSHAGNKEENTIFLPEHMLEQCDWEGKLLEEPFVEAHFFKDGVNSRKNENICFDFSQVKSIQPQAMASFIRLINKLHQKQFNFNFKGLDNPHVVQSLKLNRVWDVFNTAQCNEPVKIEADAKESLNMNCLLEINEKNDFGTIATLSGRLDANAINSIEIDNWLQQLGEFNCILDLSKLQFVDSSGLRIFFQFHKKFETAHTHLILSGVSKTIRQLMEVTKVSDLFEICNDVSSAKQLILEKNMNEKVKGNFNVCIKKSSEESIE